MKNRKIANNVLKTISKAKFIPYDVEYGNGYFIFEMGEDFVVTFRIRGLRGWVFGLWVNSGEYSLQFFTQHEDHLDKFKPSRSFFHVDYANDDLKFELKCHVENRFFEIKEILSHIKKNPIVAYEQDANDNPYCVDNYYMEYLKDKYQYYKHTFRKKYKDIVPVIQHKYKVKLLERYDIVDHVEFHDGNIKGWISYPRYDMIIHFKKLYDEDKQTNKEYDLLRKFFKKQLYDYDNIHICCARDDVNGRYSYTFN